jgi:CDP-diacylglycerol--serine O-phosphatidyltransferase
MKKHVPNMLTLLNLASGTVAIVLSLEGQWRLAVYLVLAASLFDFLDGTAARLLNAYSKTGKILDSLADMVTFGVLPGIFVYALFREQFMVQPSGGAFDWIPLQWIILASVVVIPMFSAIRLARFTEASTGGDRFLGLPTPAHTLFWTGLYWQIMRDGLMFGNPVNLFFLWAIMFIMAFHMILPVPMLSLKFRHFGFRENLFRYLVLGSAALILIFTGLPGLSLVVLTYILLSLLNLLATLRVSK